MNIETLTSEIALARDEFRVLNRLHWPPGVQGTCQSRLAGYNRGADKSLGFYCALLPEMEHRLGELAERLARLYRFRAMLTANSIANGN